MPECASLRRANALGLGTEGRMSDETATLGELQTEFKGLAGQLVVITERRTVLAGLIEKRKTLTLEKVKAMPEDERELVKRYLNGEEGK